MPYITEAERTNIDPGLHTAAANIATVGQLTYAIFYLMRAYCMERPSYARLSEAMTAGHCAGLEFYRRDVGPFEDGKRQANHDVRPQGTW